MISFSGGRTSAFMLRHILDAHGGKLPDDVHVCFMNTGKERHETLNFVRACSERWSVRVRWLEFQKPGDGRPTWREVSYDTASRAGEPFEALIAWKKYLPNPIQRLCTQWLKIETCKRFIVEELGFDDYTTAVGIRHDEPRRWHIQGRDKRNSREFKVAPLIDARVTEGDVFAFWAAQPFDLALRSHESNCDLCFLKGRAKRARIMRERPDLAAWWIAQEEGPLVQLASKPNGRRFRADGPTYAQQLAAVQRQPILTGLDIDEEDSIPCACHD